MELDLLEMVEGFMKISQAQQKHHKPAEYHKWKECIALSKLGWKATKCEKEGDSTDITIVWQKEGKEDLKITLPFVEQCLWYDYLRKESKPNEQH